MAPLVHSEAQSDPVAFCTYWLHDVSTYDSRLT